MKFSFSYPPPLLWIISVLLMTHSFCRSVGNEHSFHKKHCMVVFIHGTHITPQSLKILLGADTKNPPQAFGKTKGVMGSSTKTSLGLIPLLPTIISEKAEQNSLKTLPHKLIVSSQAFELLSTLTTTLPNHSYHFYSFNWDGKLSEKSRIGWAKVLYEQLIAEQAILQKKLRAPLEIFLLGHSFGGKVAAHLATIEKEHRKNLCVNKLITLGTPVQKELLTLISSPIFEKIYHIYSPQDYIQIAGALSSKGIYSRRVITATSTIPLPKNLTQIELNIDKTSPYHQEFWLLGTSPVFYRASLSTYPFPMVCFIPLIFDATERYAHNESFITLTLSKANDEYNVRLGDAKNKFLARSFYPFNERWKNYLHEKIDTFTPINNSIRQKLNKVLFMSSAGVAALFLKNYLHEKKDR